jgi:chitinase
LEFQKIVSVFCTPLVLALNLKKRIKMPKIFRPLRAIVSLCVLLNFVCQFHTQAPKQETVIGGYFEEWGTHYDGNTLADLHKNGTASQLTHLIYAFGDVTPTAIPACAIEDPVAAYQDQTLPSVSGKAYTAGAYLARWTGW